MVVRYPQTGRRRYAVLMGNAGIEYGLAAYSSWSVLQAVYEGRRPESVGPGVKGLAVMYDEITGFPFDDLDDLDDDLDDHPDGFNEGIYDDFNDVCKPSSQESRVDEARQKLNDAIKEYPYGGYPGGQHNQYGVKPPSSSQAGRKFWNNRDNQTGRFSK